MTYLGLCHFGEFDVLPKYLKTPYKIFDFSD